MKNTPYLSSFGKQLCFITKLGVAKQVYFELIYTLFLHLKTILEASVNKVNEVRQ